MGVRFEQFEIGKLFKSQNGNFDIKKEHINGNGTPVITAGLENNGVLGNTDVPAKIISANTITVDMFGYAFYRDFEYKMVTHARVFSLEPVDFKLSVGVGLYIVASLKWLSKRFSYSDMCSYNKIKKSNILLPIAKETDITHKYHKDGYIPDFEYMEKYIAELESERIAELESERIAELESYLAATGLNDYTLTDEDKAALSLIEPKWSNEITDSEDAGTVRFEEFEVNKLFKLQKISHKVDKLQLSDDYEYPAYSADTRNNGILGYAKVPEFICDEVNRVYLIFGDHTRTMNIARESFAVLDTVKVLIPCVDSDEAILYMCTLWKKCIQNLGYSRHWKIAKDCKLRLPITQEKDPDCKYHKDGYIPDFEFMERYIKAMQKVVIADVVKYKDEVIAQTKALVNNT